MSDNPPTNPPAVTGERVADNKAKKKRKRRTLSSSSDSSSASSASSSSSSSSSGPRRKRKRNKRARYHNRKINKLCDEIKSLKNHVAMGHFMPQQYTDNNTDTIDINVSQADRESLGAESQDNQQSNREAELNVSVATVTKEPTVARASAEMLNKLSELQRFDSDDWSNVRYAEVQKSYLHTPGFTCLEANDEVKRYDLSKSTCNTEKAFAGITYALLNQQDVLQNEMRGFLQWASQTNDLSYDDIYSKISGIFSGDAYGKASSETFQLVCGHRAEMVQHRREAILASVKDPHYKNALRKVPPTCANLFNAEKFSSALDKAGGVNKIFWPKDKDRTMTSAPQNDPRPPSQSFATNSRQPTKQAQAYPHSYAQRNKSNSRPKLPSGNFRGRGGKHPSNRGGHSKRGGRSYSPSSHRDRRAPARNKY